MARRASGFHRPPGRPGVTLPCPGVAFRSDFVGRLERLGARLTAARQRREGGGGARIAGGGEEFVGYRPYRVGEDLRRLDWDLFARLDRPYVRVTRREASEHWSIHVDASASMGVGPPGKLQAAAELACAIASLGLRARAEVRCVVGAGADTAEFLARRLKDLPALLRFFEQRRAVGAAGLEPALRQRPPAAATGRFFVIGDLLDLEPGSIAPLLAGGREVLFAQILAPVELAPPTAGAVEWVDPESDERLAVELAGEAVAAYERRLEERLELWARVAAAHGARFTCCGSDRPFEEVVRAMLEG